MEVDPRFIPLPDFREYSVDEMKRRAASFSADMIRRRTVRHFSPRPVPREIIEHCLRVAASAPSGANRQPWHFAVVEDPDVKRQIRLAAEEEERRFYQQRAPEEWLEALVPLGTDERKPFLEIAPYLIVIFAQRFEVTSAEEKIKNYYIKESVGIATGMLVAAIHNAGLASLTHTPSPMGFLNDILERPANERPFLILVVGYPDEGALVPKIRRKPMEEIRTFV